MHTKDLLDNNSLAENNDLENQIIELNTFFDQIKGSIIVKDLDLQKKMDTLVEYIEYKEENKLIKEAIHTINFQKMRLEVKHEKCTNETKALTMLQKSNNSTTSLAKSLEKIKKEVVQLEKIIKNNILSFKSAIFWLLIRRKGSRGMGSQVTFDDSNYNKTQFINELSYSHIAEKVYHFERKKESNTNPLIKQEYINPSENSLLDYRAECSTELEDLSYQINQLKKKFYNNKKP